MLFAAVQGLALTDVTASYSKIHQQIERRKIKKVIDLQRNTLEIQYCLLHLHKLEKINRMLQEQLFFDAAILAIFDLLC